MNSAACDPAGRVQPPPPHTALTHQNKGVARQIWHLLCRSLRENTPPPYTVLTVGSGGGWGGGGGSIYIYVYVYIWLYMFCRLLYMLYIIHTCQYVNIYIYIYG